MTTGRGRSLFWTLAGLSLVAVALGTLLQALAADKVLRPLEAREARAHAEAVAAALAAELAAAPAEATPADRDSLLARRRADLGARPGWIFYRAPDSTLLAVTPGRFRFDERPRGAPPRPGSPLPRLELLARRTVARGGVTLGELQIVRPVRPPGGTGSLATETALLYVPIAVLVSVLTALILVRLLVRRLRGIEALAARVTEGDLSVRIADRSGDEIGRLAQRLDRMTERLAEARARIEANERQRRQLFADITHELATPLTSIRGYAETLLDPEVTVSAEERGRYVHGVLEEARRLDRLIRDLFDLARLEAGAAPLQREHLDWVALCRNTVTRFEPRFREAGLRLTWRGPATEAWIEADGRRMEVVLENLLANALRYVPAGGAVDIGIAGMDGGSGRARLTVSDDGPGVAPEELPRVFERFYRGARAREDAALEAGSGLGLAIVREIVERHGGIATAAARAPHGLVLAIELPART